MPHLRFEYSANVEASADLPGFCAHMRDAMLATGVFPLGGIRVRGVRADVVAIADGAPDRGFLHATVLMGQGRDAATRQRVADDLYAAARAWLEPRLGHTAFALTLVVEELDSRFSRKAFNTIHAQLA